MRCRHPGFYILAVLSILLLLAPNSVRAENTDVTEAGDYLQIILPAIAGLSTLVAGNPEGGLWDREGTYQFSKSLVASLATTGIGKELTQKLRPDASDNL